MKSHALAASPLIAAVGWTVALIVDGAGRDEGSVLLIGVGLLLGGVTSVVGIVVSGGRWARRLGLSTVGGCVAVGVLRPIDAVWVIAMFLTAFAIIALNLPGVTGRVRKLPAAAGPPARAVIAPLVLLGAPFLIGVSSTDATGWPELVVGLIGPVAAFLYARVIPGGLWVLRFVWPMLAVTLAWPMDMPATVVSILVGALVGVIAWHPSVKVAFSPPREVGTTYPIPPELTPHEILDAAQLDERGRRK